MMLSTMSIIFTGEERGMIRVASRAIRERDQPPGLWVSSAKDKFPKIPDGIIPHKTEQKRKTSGNW